MSRRLIDLATTGFQVDLRTQRIRICKPDYSHLREPAIKKSEAAGGAGRFGRRRTEHADGIGHIPVIGHFAVGCVP